MDFGAMLGRVIRAARLDVSLYQEAENNTGLTQEALIVVVIAALLSGIGSALGVIIGGQGIGALFVGLIIGVVLAVVVYFIWAFITYFIGVNLFQGTADYGELQRTLGYAYAPTALGLLGFIPCVGPLFSIAGLIWALVCGVIAVREALDFDTTKAVLTVIIGWIIGLIISLVISAVVGIGAVGLGAIRGAFQ